MWFAEAGSKDNINVNNASDEVKHLPLRASKRRASQESSGSNGSSKEAKGMLENFYNLGQLTTLFNLHPHPLLRYCVCLNLDIIHFFFSSEFITSGTNVFSTANNITYVDS